MRPSLQTCYIQENSFFQLVNLPTRGSNIPDLILTTNENLVENIEITDDEAVSLSSDHKAIVFDIILRRKPKKLPKRTVYNYNKGDFAVLRESLKLLLLTDIVLSEDDIDIAWMTWSNTFLAVVSTFIPRKQTCRSYIPPYFTSEIVHLLHPKETTRKQAKKLDSVAIWEKFRDLRRRAKTLIKSRKRNYIKNLAESLPINPKKI